MRIVLRGDDDDGRARRCRWLVVLFHGGEVKGEGHRGAARAAFDAEVAVMAGRQFPCLRKGLA